MWLGNELWLWIWKLFDILIFIALPTSGDEDWMKNLSPATKLSDGTHHLGGNQALQFWRNVLWTSSKRHENVLRLTSLRHPQEVNLQPIIQIHFRCIIFSLILPNVSLKYVGYSCCILLRFGGNVTKTSR